jgi:hypothetical protein
MQLELVERTKEQAVPLINHVFNEVERIKKEHNLNPYLFGDDDGTWDNLMTNEEWYKSFLNEYEWRVFQTAMHLIDMIAWGQVE